MLPWEIVAVCDELLSKERLKLVRYSPDGKILDYLDNSDAGIDHKESARDFILSIENFVHRKAHELAAARRKMGIPQGLAQKDLTDWDNHGSQRHCKPES